MAILDFRVNTFVKSQYKGFQWHWQGFVDARRKEDKAQIKLKHPLDYRFLHSIYIEKAKGNKYNLEIEKVNESKRGLGNICFSTGKPQPLVISRTAGPSSVEGFMLIQTKYYHVWERNLPWILNTIHANSSFGKHFILPMVRLETTLESKWVLGGF